MKRIIAKFFAVIMLFAISLNASAYDFEYNGAYYNIVSVLQKTCEICGVSNKAIREFEFPEYVEYNTQQVKVIGIAEEAFRGCSYLTEIKFSSNLKYIGQSSFKGCYSLKSLNIPANVTSIRGHFFQGCDNLESITFAPTSSFKWIDGSIIKSDSILVAGNKKGVIPENITVIGNYAFKDCSIDFVHIGKNVESIGTSAFRGSSINSVTIGENIKTISSGAFSDCKKLSVVIIEDSFQPVSIGGSNIFENCPLDDVYVGRNLGYYESGFNSNSPFMSSLLKKVTLGPLVTKIPTSLFMKCSKLEKCEILGCIDSIGIYTFWSCKNLQEFPFTDLNCSIKYIEEGTFEYCESLKKIILPKTIKSLRNRSFHEIGNIEYLSINPALDYINLFGAFTRGSIDTLVVEDSENELTILAMNVSIRDIYLGRKVTFEELDKNYIRSIHYGAIYETATNPDKYNLKLKKIDLGVNIKTIEEGAFKDCNGLTNIISRNPIPPTNAKFHDTVYLNAVVQIPKGSISAYRADPNWSKFWNIQEVGQFSGVETIINDNAQNSVDVYTLQGSLVRKGVKRDEATQGLPQGVYIIGGEKVIVK